MVHRAMEMAREEVQISVLRNKLSMTTPFEFSIWFFEQIEGLVTWVAEKLGWECTYVGDLVESGELEGGFARWVMKPRAGLSC